MKSLNLHIGNLIQKVLDDTKITKAELARRLEVKPQSIDTHTLYNISNALDFDFSKYFSTKNNQINYDNNNSDNKSKKIKVLLEIELDEEDLEKINFKNKVVRVLNK